MQRGASHRALPWQSAATHLALGGFGLLMAFPFLWMLLTALKTGAEAAAFPPTFLPAQPQWGNYAAAWSSAPFGQHFLNSALVATSVTVLVMLTALLAGYAFGQLEFPGKAVLFTLYLATMMIPFEVVLIPNYLLVQRLGWYDRYWAMILPWGANVFSVFLLTQFFRSLPKDFYEAAQLDGGGHWQYLWSVAAPLARPALATAGLFAFLGSWNSLLWPLIVTQTESIQPIEVGLQVFTQQEDVNPHLLMAASSLAMVPVLGIFFATQRTFIEGVAAGVKG